MYSVWLHRDTIVMSYTEYTPFYFLSFYCIAHYIAPKKARLVAAEKVKSVS